MPFAFASHFAPSQLFPALQIYRSSFKPSVYLKKPYAMACVNVIAADTDKEAHYLATSAYQLVLGLIRNNRKPLAPPTENMLWSLEEQAAVKQMFYYSFVGSKEALANELESFVENTDVDELMTATHVFDENAKIRSMEITASLFKTNRKEVLA